jgi:hypothetical protein
VETKANFGPILPNRKSRFTTPASLRIDLHYARIGVIARWDWERFTRLALFLNYTPEEMASLICLQHSHLHGIRERNIFPGPAALLLTLVEAQVLKGISYDIISNPLPNDSPQSPRKDGVHDGPPEADLHGNGGGRPENQEAVRGPDHVPNHGRGAGGIERGADLAGG